MLYALYARRIQNNTRVKGSSSSCKQHQTETVRIFFFCYYVKQVEQYSNNSPILIYFIHIFIHKHKHYATLFAFLLPMYFSLLPSDCCCCYCFYLCMCIHHCRLSSLTSLCNCNVFYSGMLHTLLLHQYTCH